MQSTMLTPKIIHLVLYNPTPTYKQMYFHSRAWYKHFEKDMETWYYYYTKDVSEPTFDTESRMLQLPGTESYIPGILEKTLLAMLTVRQQGFQILIRSNISTIINVPVLLKNIAPYLGKELLYGGPHIMQSKNDKEPHFSFVQGTCIIFSLVTVNILLKHEANLERSFEDDRAFGHLLLDHDVRPVQIGSQYMDFDPFQNIDNIMAFRNNDVKSDRKNNIENIRCAVNALVQRYVFLKTPQVVSKVLYFNLDVTSQIVKMCRHNGWKTTQQNLELDTLFGDPSHNLSKNLMVYFKDNTKATFTQRSNLTFTFAQNELFVQ